MEKKKNLGNKYSTKYKIKWGVIVLLVTWLLLTFIVFPNLNLLGITLFPEGAFDFQPILNIMNSDRVRQSLMNSFLLGIVISFTTNIVGIFQILVLDYFKIPGRKWLSIVYYAPLVINGMVLVLAYYYLIGTDGFLTAHLQTLFPNLPSDWLMGFPAVAIQLTFSNTMYHITFVRDSLQNLDYQTVEAARNMGASTSSILRKVVLPTLIPPILAATILNFSMAVGAFASPRILGGSEFETINPLVLEFSNTITTRNYGVILAVFLGIITLIALSVFNHIQSKVNVVSVSKVKTKIQPQEITNPIAKWITTILAHLIGTIQIIPAIMVVLFSFMSYENMLNGNLNFSKFSFENWRRVFSSSGATPVFVSLTYSIAAAIISVSLVLIFARWITKKDNRATSLMEGILTVPWLLPKTLVAIGILFTFNTSRTLVFNNVLSGTLVILLIGYIVIRIPVDLRIIKAAYLGLDNSLEDAGKNLGASSSRTFVKIILPILMPTILSTLFLSFNGLFAEFDLSVFLFHPRAIPLGVVIDNATATDASVTAVMLSFVYATIIMTITGLAVYFIYGRRDRKNI